MTGDPLLFGIHEAAQEARACTAFDEARRLATWLGAGRPVTPKGVLRPGDVPEAAQVLGAMVPSRFRSAADLPWLHEPWVMALDCGFVVVEGTVAHTGEALAESVGVPDEAVLGFWWRAFRAKIEAWDDPDNQWSGIPTAPVAALRLLTAEPGRLSVEEFAGRVWDLLRHSHDVVFTPCWELAGGRDQPAIMIVELLTRFGVVASTGGKVGLSPLGGWALDQVASLTPSVVTEMMTAAEVLAAVERLDEELAGRRAGPWLGARAPITAARELLTVAVTASPMRRMVALSLVAGLDDGALPAWREAAELPRVGPAARAFLAREFGEPEPTAQDARWQVVDESVALLAEEEVAGALSDIWDNLPGNDADAKIISIEGTGHPDAGRLIEELRRYAPLAAGRPVPPVYQLKISLMHVRPSVWRRVKVSADTPLGGLHLVIQAAMGWDGDHLHQFTVNRRNFSDPAYELDVMDEWRVDLVGVLPRSGLTASYLYDFGDSWRHTVEVEEIHDAEADVTYPCCVAGKGTRPGEDGGEPELFNIERINHCLDRVLKS
ncbi:MAG: plasmid pRiA4b ORF-3 family protein [Pseudonocardiaceae bacterium]